MDLLAALREYFDLPSFRPGQEETVAALLRGEDVLSLLPTGAGKSLVYQLAAQLLPGLTIVVSPLIALMKDQVESVEEFGLAVSTISSSQTGAQSKAELQEVVNGESKLLYVTPERFLNDEFMAEMKRLDVSLFVVDEAHCVSEWGFDFRPAYLGLRPAIEQLGRPTVLALTATATPWVRNEIIERLGMRNPKLVVRGFDRPNLFLEVHRVEDEQDDYRVLEAFFSPDAGQTSLLPNDDLRTSNQGSGIIYTATTKAAAETASWLQSWGIAADCYHGRRTKADRSRVQDAFMSGELRVIAATNAFGLGVDKPDVRFVIHRDIPASVEAYYQEAGRGGRDGNPARCLLIYRPADMGRVAALSGSGRLAPEEVASVVLALRNRGDATLKELEAETGLSKTALLRIVALLRDHKAVVERRRRLHLVDRDAILDDTLLEREEHRRHYERSRLEMMRGYAELDGCRRQYILNYFGEEYPSADCGMCDNELEHDSSERIGLVAMETPFAIGDSVEHRAWGIGQVQRVADGRITVLFETAGYKTLDTDVVLDDSLLRDSAQNASQP